MAKKPTLVIDMLAAPASGEGEEESPSSESFTGQEPTSPASEDPEATIASIRSQLDSLEAALRGLG